MYKKAYNLDVLIEKILQKVPIVDYATIKSVLTENKYKSINDKISYMKKKGLLDTLKKGLFVYNSPYIKTLVSKEIIANNIYGPSYISYDYALYYHSLIPERVSEITSATTKNAKKFSNKYGIFSFKHIDKKLFALGVNIVSSKRGNFMIASSEKALCDKIYTAKALNIRSKKVMSEYLINNLRVDIDELKSFDLDIVKQYIYITKSIKVKFLFSVLQEGIQ